MSEPAAELSMEELSQHPSLLADALDSVEHGRVVRLVGQNHQDVAAIVPAELLDEMEETLAVLADSDAVRALAEARQDVASGNVVRGVDAVRALLTERGL
jgi:antitoxin YefM